MLLLMGKILDLLPLRVKVGPAHMPIRRQLLELGLLEVQVSLNAARPEIEVANEDVAKVSVCELFGHRSIRVDME